MAESMTWLQAQVPRSKWEELNKKRLELGLKWSEIILPAVTIYMETAKPAERSTAQPATKAPTKSTKAPATPKATKTTTPAKKGTKNSTPQTPKGERTVKALPNNQDIVEPEEFALLDEPVTPDADGTIQGEKIA